VELRVYFAFLAGSTIAAVPHAAKTVAVPCRMSLVSKSAPMIALAPILVALSISLSRDSLRAFSHSEVYEVTSPPKMPCIPATIFPPTPLVLTVIP